MSTLIKLVNHEKIPQCLLNQTNVVFLVAHMNDSIIGRQYIYSILDKRPRIARVYWFVNVVVTDEPYTKAYEVDMMDTDYIVKVKLHLGFKVTQRLMFIFARLSMT